MVKVSLGEIADKLSILNIKLKYITDEKKLECIKNEMALLEPHVSFSIEELYHVNKILWDVENEIRLHEKNQDFSPDFIRLARLVYHTNDKRAELKRSINENSDIAEQKQYTEYTPKDPRSHITIVTHLGMGDGIVCNGMIRYYAKKFDVITYAKKQYAENIRFMYRDLGTSVTVVPVDDDEDLFEKAKSQSNILPTGIFLGPDWEHVKPWCDAFYVNAGLNPLVRFQEFFVLRSRDDEEAFYDKVIKYLGTDKYIIVHDDPTRYKPIQIQSDLPIVRIGKDLFPIESNNIFDYCTLIERAQEYHGYDSSFAWLIELCRLRPIENTIMHRIRGQCSPGYEEFTRLKIKLYSL